MFFILLAIGVLALGSSGYWCVTDEENRKFSIPCVVLSLAICFGAFQTSQGTMYWLQLKNSTTKGNYLVVDNSGGKTMRHWILTSKYVKSSDQSDGWQFYDDDNNTNYISGDSFVMRINNPLDEFLKNYKTMYNIPEEQTALH